MELTPKYGNDGSGFKFTDNGDHAVAEVVSTIKNVPEALASIQLDLGDWEVESATVNRWEVAARVRNSDEGEMKVQELWQVKARLRRRKRQARTTTSLLPSSGTNALRMIC